MDDLVQYIVRELSFEGDLGCNITRLEILINAFYRTTCGQAVDESFFAFAWSVILQEPSVYVGILPPGDHSEVYVAPQPRGGKKDSGKARETTDVDQAASLEPVKDSKLRPLEQLKQLYGDQLRIAVDSGVLRSTLAGPHARSSTLSPIVYTVLQLVARARETGISVVDLSSKTGYDSKSCAYLVKQLQEMNLLVKLVRVGVGGNFCVLKHFYDASPTWRRIREEGNKRDDTPTIKPGEQTTEIKESLNFGPIEALHLSDLNILRSRVIKLLLNSPDHTHVTKDLILTLGFENPTKTERRFFNTRLNELANLGVIEKVTVRNSSTGKASMQCIRLIETGIGEAPGAEEGADAGPSAQLDRVKDGRLLKSNRTIQWQILDALDKAGSKGMIRTEISNLLDGFDPRIVEHFLQGFEKTRPNTNMLDFGVALVEETYGRERRHRWFTLKGYKALLDQENINEAENDFSANLDNIGGFTDMAPELFYATVDQLHQFQDTEAREETTRKKRKPPKNPILPDGTVKKGRPRKYPPGTGKRKREDTVGQDGVGDQSRPSKRVKTAAAGGDEVVIADQGTPVAEPAPRKRGRPPKRKPEGEPPAAPAPRKRGRPRKNHTPATAGERETQDNGEQIQSTAAPSVSAQEVAPVIVHDNTRPPAPSRPEALEQTLQQEAASTADTLNRVNESQPVPPVELQLPAPESREPAQRGQQDADKDPTIASTEPPATISATKPLVGQRKPNVSQARRDNEFYRVIQEFGGITVVNVKEFADAHIALLGTLAEAQEPASAPPGTRVDRRTIDTTLSKLETDGRIKVLKTTLVTPIFTTRKVTITYLPHLEEEKVQAFLSTLNQGNPGRTTIQAQKVPEHSHDLPSKPPNDAPSLTKTASSEDTAIRESIIADHHGHSVPQMYGFIVGKIARARKLHLVSLRPFEEKVNSPNIISRNARILHLDYFLRDLTIADYCSLFSIRPPVEGLDKLVYPESGSSPALRDIQENILSTLGVGASRSRNRLMELLSILEDLRLIVPLQQSQSDPPFLTCEENGTHPTSFDVVPQASWSTSVAHLSPKYWHIRESAPIHHWASPENPPPFWKRFSLRTTAEGDDFWKCLREVSLDSSFVEKGQNEEIQPEDQPNLVIRNSLRRDAGWLSTYYISSHQESFLNKFLGDPPLSDDEEAKTKLAHLSWVTLAPERVIKRFYTAALDRRAQQLRRRKKKEEASQEEKRASVAQKAAKGKDQRVKLWDQLLAKSHPALVGKPLPPRVQRVRTEFLKTSTVADEKQWEQKIATAIQEEATNQSLRLANRPRPKGPTVISFPSGSAAATEKSIAQLISEQNKMQNFSEAPVRKRKAKGKDKEEDKSEESKKRRNRFKWNPDFDELAKDAFVIIKARSRSGLRMDWAAIIQVFPVLNHNSVRQRLDNLTKDSQPLRVYLQRLEDVWYNLWMRHRRTPQLPDQNLKSMTDFDLVAHLTFLRAHIDKSTLGIGNDTLALPSSIEELMLLDIRETQPVASVWEFMWNAVTEDKREKQLLGKSMLVDEIIPSVEAPYDTEEMHVAETAVKMVVGTPNEKYNVETAAQLLQRFGDDTVSSVTESMLERSIFSKTVRDPKKPKPGRPLKISDQNQGLLNGPMPRATFRDASSLEELWIEQEEDEVGWREWPLLASDGDMAALIELVSENKIEFKIDTTQARESRTSVEYNSKKADDDELETTLQIRSHDLSWSSIQTEALEEPPSPSPSTLPGPNHGFTRDRRTACCAVTSPGLVDCQGCLDGEIERLTDYLDETEKGCIMGVVSLLNDVGPRGVGKNDIPVRLQIPGDVVYEVIDKVISRRVPLFFWTGYLSITLVSSAYLQTWSLVVPKGLVMVKPRRWTDINGSQVPETWEAGLRTVTGMIVSRPAITQAELRWRMQSVYDRQELEEVIQYLQDHRVIERRGFAGSNRVGSLDNNEEFSVNLLLGEQHWYHV